MMTAEKKKQKKFTICCLNGEQIRSGFAIFEKNVASSDDIYD